MPDAELHLLDTGHFASKTTTTEIAGLIRAFYTTRVRRTVNAGCLSHRHAEATNSIGPTEHEPWSRLLALAPPRALDRLGFRSRARNAVSRTPGRFAPGPSGADVCGCVAKGSERRIIVRGQEKAGRFHYSDGHRGEDGTPNG